MSLRNWLCEVFRFNWETVKTMLVFVPMSRGISQTAVEFHKGTVVEHTDTGERKLVIGRNRGSDVLPIGKDRELPKFIRTENKLASYVAYNADHVVDEYDVDEVEQ